ncbi:GfV-C2-ORF1 [Ichnoviriform fumiferanae]|uniref:GfV-C2-ORF1 n=1 Tax=Ichnoviriform fumiferanae TaxID=419435 RepID=A2PZW3_9VIRU|nr:GfV-C2-ORF1 [Ichnoviriform fumiferanae]BAF45535.1 GfV-C2-ORF1 [Ichnoviriform fumiferanae]
MYKISSSLNYEFICELILLNPFVLIALPAALLNSNSYHLNEFSIFFCSQHTYPIMDCSPNAMELQIINRLVEEINYCNSYLAEFKAREGLDDPTKKMLVQCQIDKAVLVARLKMTVKNFTVVPQSVREIYF